MRDEEYQKHYSPDGERIEYLMEHPEENPTPHLMTESKGVEEYAQKLHKWYLEACLRPESGFDFNPKAQEPYEALTEGSKFLDRYIAEKVLHEITEAEERGYDKGYEVATERALDRSDARD